jgi:VWFA-related protein
MAFRALILILVATAFVSAQSRRLQPTPTPEPDTVRVDTEEIKLNVLAFDEAGKFVEGVTERDLVITENNVLHPPTSVRQIPAHVLVVMDTGGEMRFVKSLDLTRRVARALVESLSPQDHVAIMQYSDKVQIVDEWTIDRKRTLGAINRTNFGRRSAFADAVNVATRLLLREDITNRHLVLITDGTDSMGETTAKFDALNNLRATDITVHVISYTAMEVSDIKPRASMISKTPGPKAIPDEIQAQLPNGVRDKGVKIGPTIRLDRELQRKIKDRKLELEVAEEKLERLAEDTNGQFILPDATEEMIEKAPIVAKMIDSSYVVTYTPKVAVAETRGVAERNIQVTAKRPGLIVEARRKLLINRN